MAVLIRVLPWVCVLLVMGGCRRGPEQWGPFRGLVIDDQTGRPLQGAHVMVTWIREPPSLHFSQWFYDAEETVTDADGLFELPQLNRVFTAFVAGPGINIFAPGYLMQATDVSPSDGDAYVDPTVVRMRPLETRDERCRHEPVGVIPDAHPYVPLFVRAVRDYWSALKCA